MIADQPFRLRVSEDEWRTLSDRDSSETGLSLHYVDLPPLGAAGRSWSFTFYWPVDDRWEGENFRAQSRRVSVPLRADSDPPNINCV